MKARTDLKILDAPRGCLPPSSRTSVDELQQIVPRIAFCSSMANPGKKSVDIGEIYCIVDVQ